MQETIDKNSEGNSNINTWYFRDKQTHKQDQILKPTHKVKSSNTMCAREEERHLRNYLQHYCDWSIQQQPLQG